MMCYLNRGLILEQAICSLLKSYFEALHLDTKYPNFHVNITTDHPFAKLLFSGGINAADSFPAVIVSTQEDRKPNEFNELAPNVSAIGIDSDDLAAITTTTEEKTNSKGVTKTVEIPGLCTVVDSNTKAAIEKVIAAQTECYGWSIRTRRKDSISIEIWAENNQLRNELYEQVRMFVSGFLLNQLNEKYSFFDIAIFDNSIVGRRSNNFNEDFGVVLSGSNITLDVNYCVEQIVLNTELNRLETEIITEVTNDVKE